MVRWLAPVAAVLAALSQPAAAEEARTVAIRFALVVDGRPVGCAGPLGGLGVDAVATRLRDARLYLHDVPLLDAAGRATPLRLMESDWQNEAVAMLDFEDGTGHCEEGTAATNDVVVGTVPAGDYAEVRFVVGAPEAMNHSSTELEAPPLDLAAMGWSWQAGRKFIRIEVDPEGGVARGDGTVARTWFVHLGATGCTGNPVAGSVSCARSNRLPVVFERFDPERQVVTLDLAALFATSRLSEDGDGASGCMSNPTDTACAAVFDRLGLSLATGEPVAPGTSPVFVVGPRP